MHYIKSLAHKIYNLIRKRYGNIYSKRSNFVLDKITSSGNILILGAREEFIRRIVDHTGKKLNYYLIDKYPSKIDGVSFEYRYSDLNEGIPFPDSYFDCIVSDQLIEHLSQPDIFITEVKRVAKNNSIIITGTENLSAWHNIFALILTLHPFSDHYSANVRIGNPLSIHHKEKIEDPFMRHFKVPTLRALKELFEYYDFKIIEIKGFGHLLPFGVFFDKYHSIQFVIVCTINK